MQWMVWASYSILFNSILFHCIALFFCPFLTSPWDDAVSTVQCSSSGGGAFYHIKDCRCDTMAHDCYDCDGSIIAEDGRTCTAYNSAYGLGAKVSSTV